MKEVIESRDEEDKHFTVSYDNQPACNRGNPYKTSSLQCNTVPDQNRDRNSIHHPEVVQSNSYNEENEILPQFKRWERNPPQQLTTTLVMCVRDRENLSTKDSLKNNEYLFWKDDMLTEAQAIKRMDCCKKNY